MNTDFFTPTLRVSTLRLLQVFVCALAIGYGLLEWRAVPALRGEDVLPLFVGDSFTYAGRSQGMTAEELQDFGTARSLANLFGMAVLGRFALWISPEYSEYIVFGINCLLLFGMFRYSQKIFQYYRVPDRFILFLLVMLANPLVISSLLSLNKEIWGLFFLSGFLWYRLTGAWFRFGVLMFCALAIRNVYSVVALLFWLMTVLRFQWWVYLTAFSLMAPVVADQGFDILQSAQDERSTGLTMLLNRVQHYPLGYLLTFWPRLLLNFYEGCNPTRLLQALEGYPLFNKVSSILFFGVSVALGRRFLMRRAPCNLLVLRAIFAYTLVACLSPIVHHRYFFPLFPYVVMLWLLPSAVPERPVHDSA